MLALKKGIGFLFAFVIYLGVGAWLLSKYAKGQLELLINQQHTDFKDVFFSYITFLGDGIFYGIVILGLYFRDKSKSALALICFLLTSFVAQFLKRAVFYDAPRPKTFFGKDANLHFVEGIEIYTIQSFPSGHSISVFSLFLLFALWSKSFWIGFICVLLALITSLSRVYLLQHFFIDTYFGAIIGTLLTWIIFQIWEKKGKDMWTL